MKITVNEHRDIQLEEVYNSIVLKTRDGEEMAICMRDSGFEFKYQGEWYSAQQGLIKKMKRLKSKFEKEIVPLINNNTPQP